MSAAGSDTSRPIFDPEVIPHDPAFDDFGVRGQAVPRDRLVPSALRERFASPPAWIPELRSDPRLFRTEGPLRPAAVLVPLIARNDGVTVLLTQRTAHLADHAGQISLPGGRVEVDDADAIATALRESSEEVGLDSSLVEVLGSLPVYSTVTGYRVTPVIGLIERPFSLRLDDYEVSEAFEVPLAFLMDPAHHQRHLAQIEGAARTFYAMPYAMPNAQRRPYFIWGATAAMLRNLYHFLRA